MLSTRISIIAASIGYALAHGRVTSPAARVVGAGTEAKCGTPVFKSLKTDPYGPIEDAVKKIDLSTYDAEACHLYFCKGYQIEDNVSNTRVYKVGDVVPMTVELVAHHTGYANVSIVDLTAQVPLARLLTWDVYADSSLGPSKWPVNETSFSVTIPPDLGDACKEPGQCAIQWFWYATENSQTYESCIDFTTA